MSRERVLFLAVSIAVVFLVFNPFKRSGARIQGADAKTRLALYAQVVEQHQSPEDYVVSLFNDHDIVLLGEQQSIADQLLFVADLIPALDAAGVHFLGIEYANASDQAEIDRVLTAPEYDAEAVNGILFRYLVIWGFQEYADLFHAAWKVNAAKQEGQEPFRILGLNIERNWGAIRTQKDLEDPEARKAVIAAGLPDQVMAQTLIREVVAGGEKAAVLCSFQSSFTDFQFKGYVENARKQGLSSTLRLGNFLYEEIGGRAVTVLLHGPWHDEKEKFGIGYPFGGAIDELIRALPEDKRRFGLTLPGTAFEQLGVTGSFSRGYARLTLGEMAGGYVVLGPLGEYAPVTPIPEFINEGNIDQAIARFPGPAPGNISVAEFNQFIAGIPQDYQRALDTLK
ncbi:MAG: hypothetical protein JXB03_03950 [Spirochaetales bacterium]|nr:hypothetical protein [Spirochaetales bacterium]